MSEEYSPYNAMFDDVDDMKKVSNQVCECGHALYLHANTMDYDYFANKNFLRVRQCTFCGCTQFKLSKSEK